MANLNSFLAKKTYDNLSEEGLRSSQIEEATFTTLSKTGKMQLKNGKSSLLLHYCLTIGGLDKIK